MRSSHMIMTQIEVITPVERRRRSSSEKERPVAASLEPGAVVSAQLARLLRPWMHLFGDVLDKLHGLVDEQPVVHCL
jgi:transposase-like protein